MAFRLIIRTDSPAVVAQPEREVVRLLRLIADKLESGTDDYGFYRPLFDTNGEGVGTARLRKAGERDD